MGPQVPSAHGWRIERERGLAWIACDALSRVPGVGHAFSTRSGPDGEPFDLGAHEDLGDPFSERRRRLCEAAGLEGQRPLALRQVHGNRVVSVGQAVEGEPFEADGIVASRAERPGLAAAIRTADCVPVLLAAPDGRAVAAVHAGWRGTAEAIVARAVERMGQRGIPPEGMIAAIGPAIGPCCYEVGEEVAEAVARASGVDLALLFRRIAGAWTLDLPGANRHQLRRAGLREEAIRTAPWCTACRPDLFFSYRREGGPTGRLMACIGWTEDPPAP